MGNGGKTVLLLKQGTRVQVSAPPLPGSVITGNLSIPKHLICKMGTGTMASSAVAAGTTDKGESLKCPRPPKEICMKARDWTSLSGWHEGPGHTDRNGDKP